MSAILLNRATVEGDEWIHVTPRGEFKHSESGLVEVYDLDAEAAMIANFALAEADPAFGGIHFGEEHFLYDPSKSTRAFGWVRELRQSRDGEKPGLWGRVELTPAGKAAIENREWKFVSPVHLRSHVEFIDGNRVRPTAIDSVGLTNNPNLRGMEPIRNRDTNSAPGDGNPDAAKHPAGNQPHKITMENTLTALGLAADATDKDALAAVTALKNRAESAEAERDTLREAQVATDLKRFENRIGKDAMPFWKSSLIENRDETIKALEALPEPKGTVIPPTGPILNRAAAATPAGTLANRANSKAGQIEKEVRIIMNRDKTSYDRAFDVVLRDKPELFQEEAAA